MICKLFIVILIILNCFFLFQISTIATPIDIYQHKNQITEQLQSAFNISSDIAEMIYKQSTINSLNPLLIAALCYTESEFNPKAKSCKGYKGIMQTKTISGYTEADLLHGILVLKEKLELSDGNLKKAIIMYKGYKIDSARGNKQAEKVLDIYKQLKKGEKI